MNVSVAVVNDGPGGIKRNWSLPASSTKHVIDPGEPQDGIWPFARVAGVQWWENGSLLAFSTTEERRANVKHPTSTSEEGQGINKSRPPHQYHHHPELVLSNPTQHSSCLLPVDKTFVSCLLNIIFFLPTPHTLYPPSRISQDVFHRN